MRAAILILLLCAACAPYGLTAQQAIAACQERCQNATNLDSQCLGNLDPHWVCDIAHNPRQPQDNLEKNQCPGFLDGSHTQFVELTPDCALIRTKT